MNILHIKSNIIITKFDFIFKREVANDLSRGKLDFLKIILKNA